MSTPSWAGKFLDDHPELLVKDTPLAGRIQIEPREWLASDEKFERALEYEIQGMRKDVSALRSELLRRKREAVT